MAPLFDADTKRAVELAAHVDDAEADKIIVAPFIRRGRPMYAYWYPADLMKDWTVRKVGLRVAAAADSPVEKSASAGAAVDKPAPSGAAADSSASAPPRRVFDTASADKPVPSGAAVDKPVLADLLSGQVYALPDAKRDGPDWLLPQMPLADYPLVVMDAAAD
jgi:hypothetical protein